MFLQVMAPNSTMPPSGQMEQGGGLLGALFGGAVDLVKGVWGNTDIDITDKGVSGSVTVNIGGVDVSYTHGVNSEGKSGLNINDPSGTAQASGAPAFIPDESFLQKYSAFLLLGGIALAVYFVTK